MSISYSPFVFAGGGSADIQLTLSDSSTLPEGAFRFSGTAYGQIGKIVKSVSSKSIISIGDYGLADMPVLETVDLPSCISIGNYALRVPNTTVGQETPLKVVVLPKLQTVGEYVFRYRVTLETVTLGSVGNPVTSISSNAFSGCTQSTLTITVYTSDGSALSGSPWGATNAAVKFEKA